LHKSDIGGVEVVRNREELEEKYHKLFSIAKKKRFILNGILVQEYIEGQQLIIGIQNDATFGHVIMFGLGGIFVEVLKDVSFRVCPITYDDAQSMIDELKGKAILDGVRGQQPVNQRALIEALVTCSTIPDKHPELQELDINPFILNHRRGKVVDARITLG
jgi:acetate---CoA ligase (ADP-forming)